MGRDVAHLNPRWFVGLDSGRGMPGHEAWWKAPGSCEASAMAECESDYDVEDGVRRTASVDG